MEKSTLTKGPAFDLVMNKLKTQSSMTLETEIIIF